MGAAQVYLQVLRYCLPIHKTEDPARLMVPNRIFLFCLPYVFNASVPLPGMLNHMFTSTAGNSFLLRTYRQRTFGFVSFSASAIGTQRLWFGSRYVSGFDASSSG